MADAKTMSLGPGLPAVVFVALSPMIDLLFFAFRAMESVLGAIASGGTHWAALGRLGPPGSEPLFSARRRNGQAALIRNTGGQRHRGRGKNTPVESVVPHDQLAALTLP